jgi:hypothetical protein
MKYGSVGGKASTDDIRQTLGASKLNCEQLPILKAVC